jgi:FkbM family methyltransferase
VKKVVAMEPEPTNVRHLRENLDLNHVTNVTVIEAAAMPTTVDTVSLGLGKTFTYTHKVGHTRGRHHIQVRTFHINDVIMVFGINKIKIDCEGLEYELLKILDYDSIEEIILEWHFTLIPDTDWSKLREVLELLKSERFEILRAPADLTKPTKRWTAIVWAKRP